VLPCRVLARRWVELAPLRVQLEKESRSKRGDLPEPISALLRFRGLSERTSSCSAIFGFRAPGVPFGGFPGFLLLVCGVPVKDTATLLDFRAPSGL